MLSTFHQAKLVVTNKVNRNNEPVVKPNTVIDYCKFMDGVDVNDQICQYYDVLRKSVKWWRTLYFHLFNLLLVNVYTNVYYTGSTDNLQSDVHIRISGKALFVHY